MRFLPSKPPPSEEVFLHPAGEETGRILDEIASLPGCAEEEDTQDAAHQQRDSS